MPKNKRMSIKEFDRTRRLITEYINSKGATVSLYSNTFGYYPERNHISCSSKSVCTYLYIVSYLHECGHAIQPEHSFQKCRPSINQMRAVISELEYTAWSNAKQIAIHLNIWNPNLQEQFEKYFLEYWSQYNKLLYSNSTLYIHVKQMYDKYMY